jgi:hypothetical protein
MRWINRHSSREVCSAPVYHGVLALRTMSRPVELAGTVAHVPLVGHTVTLGGKGQVMSLCLDSYSHCANTGWFHTCETLGLTGFTDVASPHITSGAEMWDASMDWNRFLTVKCEAFCHRPHHPTLRSLCISMSISRSDAARHHCSPPAPLPLFSLSLYTIVGVCVCVSRSHCMSHAYIYRYTYVYTHTHTRANTHTNTKTHTDAYMYIYIQAMCAVMVIR